MFEMYNVQSVQASCLLMCLNCASCGTDVSMWLQCGTDVAAVDITLHIRLWSSRTRHNFIPSHVMGGVDWEPVLYACTIFKFNLEGSNHFQETL